MILRQVVERVVSGRSPSVAAHSTTCLTAVYLRALRDPMLRRVRVQSVLLPLISMPRKSARALAANVRTSPPASKQSRAVSTLEQASDASVKTCLTCGRMITPRAKWAKNWGEIKHCSDRCRSSRPGKVVVPLHTSSGTEPHDSLAGIIEQIGNLSSVSQETKEGGVVIDVEALVEAVLLSTAARADKIGTKQGATLEDAAEVLHTLAPSPTEEATSIWKALDSPPGLRERIRRAARRLAMGISHESVPEQALIVTTEAGKLHLFNNGTMLTSVEQLSFAKGTIHMRLPPRSR